MSVAGIKHSLFGWLLLSLSLSLLPLPTTAQQGNGGLFPPVNLATNFASRTDVVASSTCSQYVPCSEGDCPASSCNDTCPFGQELPSGFGLLEAGVLRPGVQRVS